MAKQQFLRLAGLTRADRIQVTADVSDAIGRAGAWIVDFHQYSNLLICINFQVPGDRLDLLGNALQATNLQLSADSLDQLKPAMDSTWREKEFTGTLQITFIHHEPDLLREIPAVPG